MRTSLKAQLRAPVGIPCKGLAHLTVILSYTIYGGEIEPAKEDYLFYSVICNLIIFTSTQLDYVCRRRSGFLVLRALFWRCSELFVDGCPGGEETLDVALKIRYSCTKYPFCCFVQKIRFLPQPVISLQLLTKILGTTTGRSGLGLTYS